jgi:hypothetical protein
MEVSMVLKRYIKNAQANIMIGRVFFLIGIFSSMVADGRLLGVLLTSQFSGRALEIMQGFFGGFSIPMLLASIYFSMRGLRL